VELERKNTVLDAHPVGRKLVERGKAENEPTEAVFLRGKELPLILGKHGCAHGQATDHARHGKGHPGPPQTFAPRGPHRPSARPTPVSRFGRNTFPTSKREGYNHSFGWNPNGACLTQP